MPIRRVSSLVLLLLLSACGRDTREAEMEAMQKELARRDAAAELKPQVDPEEAAADKREAAQSEMDEDSEDGADDEPLLDTAGDEPEQESLDGEGTDPDSGTDGR